LTGSRAPREDLNRYLSRLFKEVGARHLGYLPDGLRYFPTPLVGHVLRSVREARPLEFSPVHIIARDVRTAVAVANRDKQFNVSLPKLTLSRALTDDPTGLWQPRHDEDAGALIARYVAGLMIGIVVSYAPRNLLLDFLSGTMSATWRPIIEAGFGLNGGKLMRTYIEQVRSRRVVNAPKGDVDPWSITASNEDKRRWQQSPSAPDAVVVGIDIGGTTIKARGYHVGDLNPVGPACEIPWPVAARGQSLAVAVLDRVRRALERCDHPAALGISLAAPVMDGVPVGISTVSSKLLGKRRPRIADSNPHTLHDLDFREAAERMRWCERTVVLNDGEADIRASESTRGVSGQGVTVVLKEGTGIAFAVYEDGVSVDLLAETGKAVLNLRCRVPADEEERGGRFQAGLLSERCSKKKLGTIDAEFGIGLWKAFDRWRIQERDRHDVASLLVGSLLELAVDPDRNRAGMGAREIADLWVGDDPGAATATAGDRVSARLCAKLSPGTRAEVLVDLLRRLERSLGRLSARRADVLRDGEAFDEMRDRGRPPREPAGDAPDVQPDSRQPPSYGQLGGPIRAAIACARILGRWLADAIALTWEVFGAREVRVAGGPLGGLTGMFVTFSARQALEEVYGFDLEAAEEATDVNQKPPAGWTRVTGHGPREVKRLRMNDPPRDGSDGGPRGAALAAFDAYLANLKLGQLRMCRSWVADRTSGAMGERRTFSAAQLGDEVSSTTSGPWLLTSDEISNMLARESSALSLTRTGTGDFERWSSADATDPA
jgi:hypothetical protein